MMADEGPRSLLVNGTVGAGKTATVSAIGALLTGRGIPHMILDLDELRRVWPAPERDPFSLELELRNLADVARNAVAAGYRRLILAGVVETRAARERYETMLEMPLAVCRLEVDLALVRTRLAHRHGEVPDRDWHLARSGELDAILRRERPDDVVLDVGEDDVEEVARRVLTAVAW